jgi:hypothetical protein
VHDRNFANAYQYPIRMCKLARILPHRILNCFFHPGSGRRFPWEIANAELRHRKSSGEPKREVLVTLGYAGYADMFSEHCLNTVDIHLRNFFRHQQCSWRGMHAQGRVCFLLSRVCFVAIATEFGHEHVYSMCSKTYAYIIM